VSNRPAHPYIPFDFIYNAAVVQANTMPVFFPFVVSLTPPFVPLMSPSISPQPRGRPGAGIEDAHKTGEGAGLGINSAML
jgi:hypothetical protein